MNSAVEDRATLSHPQQRRWPGPALTLVFLAPFIAEVLSGATKVSILFAFVPEMMVWGCGALLIRETVRRWRGGWPSLLLLGLCLSIAEEWIIQQTSLAPLPFSGALAHYGRLGGVNWIFFLFMLGFESVFVVMVPVQLTELIFSDRRAACWLRKRGLIVASILFLLGSRIAWYAWVKRARPVVLHAPDYHVPAMTLAIGFLAIALLVMLAYAVRAVGHPGSRASRAPSPWVVGIVTVVLGFPWYALMGFIFTPREPRVPFAIVLAAGAAWATLVWLLFRRWTAASGWSDLHRWAASSSATLVCMVAGYLGSSVWLRMDLYGKILLNGIAAAGLLLLLKAIRTRTTSENLQPNNPG